MLRIALISVNGTPLLRPLVAEFGEAGGGIGRDERNKLALPDPERRLSRVQALVRFERNYFSLVDQGATPTVVNGIVLAKGSSLRLRDGDFIDAAGFRMRVELTGVGGGNTDIAGTQTFRSSSPTPSSDISEPWGAVTPALGALSEPADRLAVQTKADTPLLADPFDELLAEKVSEPEHIAERAMGKPYEAILEAFSPERLACRLQPELSEIAASGEEEAARLWKLYQRHFPDIVVEVAQVLATIESGMVAVEDMPFDDRYANVRTAVGGKRHDG